MSELGQELIYDPIEGAIVAEENAKLKARAENLSKEVEAMDNDCVVDRCIFRHNTFGDITQVVCM